MRPLPQSPSDLKKALAAIFPILPRDFGVSGESVFEDAGPTFQSLLREFAHFFERHLDEFPDRQLRRFAELVVRARAQPGALAEAFEHCFLAQLPQGGAARLQGFLARAAS